MLELKEKIVVGEHADGLAFDFLSDPDPSFRDTPAVKTGQERLGPIDQNALESQPGVIPGQRTRRLVGCPEVPTDRVRVAFAIVSVPMALPV